MPLNSRAWEVLVRLEALSRSEYVFSKPNGLPYKSMDKLFTRACEDAGLTGTLRTIQVLGGWRDLSLVQRYSHSSPGHCRQAIERIVEKFPAKLPPTPETGAVVQLAERLVSM